MILVHAFGSENRRVFAPLDTGCFAHHLLMHCLKIEFNALFRVLAVKEFFVSVADERVVDGSEQTFPSISESMQVILLQVTSLWRITTILAKFDF